MTIQSHSQFIAYADGAAVAKEYKGDHVDELPTPAAIIDLTKFTRNCNAMLESASRLGASFRAHVKTHKTLAGTKIQMGLGLQKTDRIVVLTLLEAWFMLPLVESGVVSDILIGFPVISSRLPEIDLLLKRIPKLRLMIDHPDQVKDLVQWSIIYQQRLDWLVFIKVDQGSSRAGQTNGLTALQELTEMILLDPEYRNFFSLCGFYVHAGQLYNARSQEDAKTQLLSEIEAANNAAAAAKKLRLDVDLILSVGATPTAHAASALTSKLLEEHFPDGLCGKLELHAGNYPCCDLQQHATGCAPLDNVSFTVLAEVVSLYPGRGEKEPGEVLVNAGVLALSRETGPIAGFGKVTGTEQYGKWVVDRLSQEHGILVSAKQLGKPSLIPYGTKLRIVPQHACITAANFPWYFVVENDIVVDVWVPARGW